MVRKSLFYSGLFLICFLFFVYISFPYTVLKETLVNKLRTATGIELTIGKLAPVLPLGFDFESVGVLLPSGQKGIELARVTLRLSILELVTGGLGVDVKLLDKVKGELSIFAAWNILDIISEELSPKALEIDSRHFQIGHIAKFAMAKAKDGLAKFPMVGDLIDKFSIEGMLHGKLDLYHNPSDIKKSKGTVNLKIEEGQLIIDPSLNLANQKFKSAQVLAQLQNGDLVIDSQSGLHTQGLSLDINGKISLKKKLIASTLDLGMSLALMEVLKDQFGFVIDSFLSGSGGAFKAQIRGTLDEPNFVPL